MMGFLRHIQPEKFRLVNQKNRESSQNLPYLPFQLVKISLDGLLPSRAHLRFSLQEKNRQYELQSIIILLTESSRKPNLVSTVFMKGQTPHS
jgi:hypothetical protein